MTWSSCPAPLPLVFTCASGHLSKGTRSACSIRTSSSRPCAPPSRSSRSWLVACAAHPARQVRDGSKARCAQGRAVGARWGAQARQRRCWGGQAPPSSVWGCIRARPPGGTHRRVVKLLEPATLAHPLGAHHGPLDGAQPALGGVALVALLAPRPVPVAAGGARPVAHARVNPWRHTRAGRAAGGATHGYGSLAGHASLSTVGHRTIAHSVRASLRWAMAPLFTLTRRLPRVWPRLIGLDALGLEESTDPVGSREVSAPLRFNPFVELLPAFIVEVHHFGHCSVSTLSRRRGVVGFGWHDEWRSRADRAQAPIFSGQRQGYGYARWRRTRMRAAANFLVR